MSDLATQPKLPARSNRRVALALVGLVALMVGAAYASVPLYELFCKVTGYGGTTQVASDNPKGIIDREMTVRFDANVTAGLPWKVTGARRVTDRIGKVETIVYVAENLSSRQVTGMATFNVVPERAGAFFNKIECFCFEEQRLEGGESLDMPVLFYLDPQFEEDPRCASVNTITLSYTFFRVDGAEENRREAQQALQAAAAGGAQAAHATA